MKRFVFALLLNRIHCVTLFVYDRQASIGSAWLLCVNGLHVLHRWLVLSCTFGGAVSVSVSVCVYSTPVNRATG